MLLVAQPLIKAQAKDYVCETQERLIGVPVVQRLEAELGSGGAEQVLLALLEGWRNRPYGEQGYGPGNVVNLLRLLRGDLRGLGLGRLALRQAYLAGIEAQDASLAGAHLSEAVLAQAFNFPSCVALSGDGASLVAGTSAGEIWLWRVADRTPLLMMQGHTSPVYGLALSADGRLLASGSQDGTLRLWSLAAEQGGDKAMLGRTEAPGMRPLAMLRGHTGRTGVTAAQRAALLALGAVDHQGPAGETTAGPPLRSAS